MSGPSAFLDVTDKSNITRLVAENGITWIIHLGALLSAIGEKMRQKAVEVNVHGSENIIDVARQYKCHLYIPPISLEALLLIFHEVLQLLKVF